LVELLNKASPNRVRRFIRHAHRDLLYW
jgi:hypothetical protein